MKRHTASQAANFSCLRRIGNGVLFFLLGALILCFFSMIQKIILLGELNLEPRGYIMPVLYGGATGFIIGEWYLRLKQNERQIMENSERLRTLINAMPDFVIFKDGNGRWQDINNVGREFFQFSAEEYRGLTDLEMAEQKTIFGGLLRYCNITDIEAWERGEIIHCQVGSLPFRGRMREFDLVKVPLFWADGERKGMVIIGRDITEIRDSQKNLVEAYDSTLEGWAKAVEMRDKSTEDHTRRVVALTENLAQLVGVPEADMIHIRRGAMLHDIGKIGIPDAILRKPAELNDEEWQVMVQHPEQAREMLSKIVFLCPALDIPYCHHEHWDGSGYPRGLKGAEIPLAARLFAIVDVWDALTSDRPYRKAWTEEEALAYIQNQSGKYFDPALVQVFLDHLPSLLEAGND
jgi:PAS domain S-box-containing protein/putative nucleotidyltransferase with HDIG domain